jgi:hypothetical protein
MVSLMCAGAAGGWFVEKMSWPLYSRALATDEEKGHNGNTQKRSSMVGETAQRIISYGVIIRRG